MSEGGEEGSKCSCPLAGSRERGTRPDGFVDAIHHPVEGGKRDDVRPFPMPPREGREYLQKIDVRGCRHEEVAAWLW
eukprot:2161287-Karenia_brevis.AAC.1